MAILDADKEGFLRSERSLVQTIGRAARNIRGRVIMYADKVTPSMDKAISETNRRRRLQMDFNKNHNIEPKTIVKPIRAVLRPVDMVAETIKAEDRYTEGKELTPGEMYALVVELEKEMHEAADRLEFELAAQIRDEIKALEQELKN